MNLRRVNAVAWKEFIQIRRDPRSLGLALVIPMFLLIIFGYGLSLDIDHVRTVIWNQDASSELTRDFLLNFKNSKYFKIVGYADNYRDIERMINGGEVMMALIIPKDFSHYLDSGKAAPLQLIMDGSDANTATIARGYVQTVVAKYNVNLLSSAFARHGLEAPQSVDARSRIWFNMGLTSTWFIAPGVIAMIIMIIAISPGTIKFLDSKLWLNQTRARISSALIDGAPALRRALVMILTLNLYTTDFT